jgi:DNA repair protein RecN (Recombination protein N)
MATATVLGEQARALIDLHGQHAHQSLLAPQRATSGARPVRGHRPRTPARGSAERRRIAAALEELGGDAGARAREADLLRFQVREIDEAALADPDEDASLDARRTASPTRWPTARRRLGPSRRHRRRRRRGRPGRAGGRRPGRPRSLRRGRRAAPFGRRPSSPTCGAEVRTTGEAHRGRSRAASPRSATRRQLLVELRRKYGSAPRTPGARRAAPAPSPTSSPTGPRCAERWPRSTATTPGPPPSTASRRGAPGRRRVSAARVGAAGVQRRPAWPRAVEATWPSWPWPGPLRGRGGRRRSRRRRHLHAGRQPRLGTGPLAKVASGGELARAMLALRLVLSVAPPVLVFDEVDAGIGGAAAGGRPSPLPRWVATTRCWW